MPVNTGLKVCARFNPETFDPSAHTIDFSPYPDPDVAPEHLVLEGFVPNGDAGGERFSQVLEWLNAPHEVLSQEHHDAFALWCEVDAIDRQVRELETTLPVGVTEILARRAALKELHAERARLLAVLDGKELPAQEPSPAPVERPLNEAPTTAATTVEPQPNRAPTRAKRLNWLDVAGPYITEVLRTGQHPTAKHLFRALEDGAGRGSPFDKGTGNNRGRLFVRDIGQLLALKTVQNNFDKLREMVQKPAL